MIGAGVLPDNVMRITPVSSTISIRRAVMRSWSGVSTRVCGALSTIRRCRVSIEGRLGESEGSSAATGIAARVVRTTNVQALRFMRAPGRTDRRKPHHATLPEDAPACLTIQRRTIHRFVKPACGMLAPRSSVSAIRKTTATRTSLPHSVQPNG
ncbi:hypothetical protein G6F35_017076 [Rhizopus arrhizus]|nr:hypothetical protein G6F35_017076 [Rhizopus arrhizus]